MEKYHNQRATEGESICNKQYNCSCIPYITNKALVNKDYHLLCANTHLRIIVLFCYSWYIFKILTLLGLIFRCIYSQTLWYIEFYGTMYSHAILTNVHPHRQYYRDQIYIINTEASNFISEYWHWRFSIELQQIQTQNTRWCMSCCLILTKLTGKNKKSH